MSDTVGLTDRDRQVLETVDTDIADAETREEYEELVSDLCDKLNRQGDELAQLKSEFRTFKNDVYSRFDALEQQSPQKESPDTPIENLANIPKDEREETLSTSRIIAVTLHDEWDDIAWDLGGGSNVHGDRIAGKTGVDTKTKATAKNNPSKLRHLLKVSLERDFQANEIYRGMKRLAKLSGGKEHVNDDGRSTIAGGIYKYREVTTADNRENRRVLWRKQDDN